MEKPTSNVANEINNLIDKPNHLTLVVTGGDKSKLFASVNLMDVQKLSDSHGDEGVAKCVHGIFKDLLEKLKNAKK